MRAFAVCGSHVPTDAVEIDICGKPVRFGLVDVPKPQFNLAQNTKSVLIKVKGFSCGYRDKTIILNAADRCKDNDIYVIGSDFVGEVIAIGADVEHIQVGQRVIGDNHWTGQPVDDTGVLQGIPTNHAAYEYIVLPSHKVCPIPDTMPDAVAAGFSLYSQTAYSLVRRLAIQPEDTVLVTAARSNTALFVLNALQSRPHKALYALTTSDQAAFHATLEAWGASVITLDDLPQLDNVKFDKVIDPFFDIYLERLLPYIRPGGHYTTCGFYTQHQQQLGDVPPINGQAIMINAMMHNIHLIGNCLGLTDDLHHALDDYANGLFDIPIDHVVTNDDIETFVMRTYNTPDAIGRTVYLYD